MPALIFFFSESVYVFRWVSAHSSHSLHECAACLHAFECFSVRECLDYHLWRLSYLNGRHHTESWSLSEAWWSQTDIWDLMQMTQSHWRRQLSMSVGVVYSDSAQTPKLCRHLREGSSLSTVGVCLCWRPPPTTLIVQQKLDFPPVESQNRIKFGAQKWRPWPWELNTLRNNIINLSTHELQNKLTAKQKCFQRYRKVKKKSVDLNQWIIEMLLFQQFSRVRTFRFWKATWNMIH